MYTYCESNYVRQPQLKIQYKMQLYVSQHDFVFFCMSPNTILYFLYVSQHNFVFFVCLPAQFCIFCMSPSTILYFFGMSPSTILYYCCILIGKHTPRVGFALPNRPSCHTFISIAMSVGNIQPVSLYHQATFQQCSTSHTADVK